MLSELYIRHFALIKQAQLSFNKGMTVFSGETGAGKSMLMAALSAAFGQRAQADWVRHGEPQAEITVVLEQHPETLQPFLTEQGLDVNEALIIRRIITADGRSKAYINDRPASLRSLKHIAAYSLDMHGQHAQQRLLDASYQQQVLDSKLAAAPLAACKKAYQHWRQIHHKRQQGQQQRRETEQKEAWLRDTLAKLEDLELETGLRQKLQERVDAGRHHADIQQALHQALAVLDESEETARSMLGLADKSLQTHEQHHPGLQKARMQLGQIEELLDEAVHQLKDLQDESFDEQQLAEDENRLLDLHDALRRQQCADEQELIALQDSIQQQLSQLETAAWDEEQQLAEEQACEQSYRQLAEQLHQARQQASKKLIHELRPFLDQLALKGMQLHIELKPAPDDKQHWHAHGWDSIQFCIAANPGEPFRDLAQTASGGELSRLSLALKACSSIDNSPELIIFDEVDVGIGGETAWHVGRLLHAISRQRQVLVISHLPQVAACAEQHILIHKQQQQQRTFSQLQELKEEQRIHEVARMLGGYDEQSLQHSRQVLQQGKEHRHA